MDKQSNFLGGIGDFFDRFERGADRFSEGFGDALDRISGEIIDIGEALGRQGGTGSPGISQPGTQQPPATPPQEQTGGTLLGIPTNTVLLAVALFAGIFFVRNQS